MGRKEKKGIRIFSRLLTVLIVFLAIICMILFFKTVTKSEISLFGFKFYYVATESMYPTIKPDSLIVVKKVDADKLVEGDIISFVSSDPEIYGLVNTHRIYEITTDEEGRKAFVTMGDNNPWPDSYYVYPEDLEGKVIFHTFPMKALTSVMEFAATKTGFFVVIIMPLILVAGMFGGSFLKEFQNTLAAEQSLYQEMEGSNRANPADGGGMDGGLTPSRGDEYYQMVAARNILADIFGKPVEELTKQDIIDMLVKVQMAERQTNQEKPDDHKPDDNREEGADGSAE